ncbi:glycosyltransferase family 2 protein [Clostridium sardiniense]|uniref:Glycosyltransferase family 2 protein n=1 Tax=Clostridium sardiniense TaxID=29369 RepID=A0ABS7KTN4_CLOSR|nr:glycosyltransferase family A protein [Clostridium sardiniense]MBY0753932.1 glycosyltransferase family 2 protein [Clostridium sardiniense]MDQ0459553.1 glycosyltransferase involved in cell wall biosynthesis [Clostridium sardiniense]
MKISIVIPMYNSERYIEKCINSIIKQTYENWECIVIDDGSTDKSYSILKQISENDKRIKIYSNKNQGAGKSRNYGIEQISGDYIIFIDSYDYIEKNYFEQIYKAVKENDNPDIIFIDLLQEKPDGDIIKRELLSKYKGIKKEKIIRYQMTGKLPWGGVRKVVKSCIIKDNKIRYSSDMVGEEAIFSFDVLNKSNKVIFLDGVQYHYVNYENSLSKKGGENPWGPVSKNMREHLINIGLMNRYEETLNSLAFTSLIISLYRISSIYNFRDASKKCREAVRIYRRDWDSNLDIDSLETRVKLFIPFIKVNSILPILMISKFKKIIKECR